MVAVEELLVLAAQHLAGLVVGLPELLDETGLGQAQRHLAEFGVPENVEEELEPLVHILAHHPQSQGRSPLAHVERQRAAEKVDAFLDGVALAGGGAAGDEGPAHHRAETGLVLRHVRIAEVHQGRQGDDGQVVVFLDVAAQPAGKGGSAGARVGRLVPERGKFQVGRPLGLAQAGGAAHQRQRQDEDDDLVHCTPPCVAVGRSGGAPPGRGPGRGPGRIPSRPPICRL